MTVISGGAAADSAGRSRRSIALAGKASDSRARNRDDLARRGARRGRPAPVGRRGAPGAARPGRSRTDRAPRRGHALEEGPFAGPGWPSFQDPLALLGPRHEAAERVDRRIQAEEPLQDAGHQEGAAADEAAPRRTRPSPRPRGRPRCPPSARCGPRPSGCDTAGDPGDLLPARRALGEVVEEQDLAEGIEPLVAVGEREVVERQERDQTPLGVAAERGPERPGRLAQAADPARRAPARRARSPPDRRRRGAAPGRSRLVQVAWTVIVSHEGSRGLKPGSTNASSTSVPGSSFRAEGLRDRVPRDARALRCSRVPDRVERLVRDRLGEVAAGARHRVDRVDLGRHRPVDVGHDAVLDLRLGQRDRLGDRREQVDRPACSRAGSCRRGPPGRPAASGSGRSAGRSSRRGRGPPAPPGRSGRRTGTSRAARSTPGAAGSRRTSGPGSSNIPSSRPKPTGSIDPAGSATVSARPSPARPRTITAQASFSSELVERVRDRARPVEVEPEPVERRGRTTPNARRAAERDLQQRDRLGRLAREDDPVGVEAGRLDLDRPEGHGVGRPEPAGRAPDRAGS